ncbi:hypothetical protein DFH29DRAFT_937713 [Suillus ampliporus]|nr:hypothetical protein DFH29DRAFT_937713 [Suillus ampliporus]
MKFGDFIGDYVGTILMHEHASYLEHAIKFSNRNYLFEFLNHDEAELVDAARVGNATRFLNHSNGKENCGAQVLLVNGEHHIKFFISKAVSRGQELFLSYGDTYWPQGGGSEPLSD